MEKYIDSIEDTARMRITSSAKAAARGWLLSVERGSHTLWMEVLGDSMGPALRPRDRIEVERVAASGLRLGDVAVLDVEEAGWVVHRFFWCRSLGRLRTKGDARPYFDPPWPGSSIIGRVRSFERDGTRRACSRAWLLRGTLRSILIWCGARLRRRQPGEQGE